MAMAHRSTLACTGVYPWWTSGIPAVYPRFIPTYNGPGEDQ